MAQDMVRHKQLIKTDAEWTASTLILLSGELGYASDTGLIKVGDGIHTWAELPNLNNAFQYDEENKRLIFS